MGDRADSGRIVAIAELLRLGHSPDDISAALKLTDAGDAAGAIKLLAGPKAAEPAPWHSCGVPGRRKQ